jgi:small subunit ribosomal protein S2
MEEVSLKDLLETGCHFGHQTTRWNPKMKPYIFTARDRIHIFDLVKTKEGLEKGAAFAKATASQGGQILFVGTKRQAQDIVLEAAKKVGMPYITERWIGGLLTNWEMVKKRIQHLADLKAGVAEGRFKDRTKKENLLIQREIAKLERVFGGIADLKGIPAAIFVTDARKDAGAVKEAKARQVKTVAIVDTNANPEGIDFVIPANDDATKCLQLIIGVITLAVEEGQKQLKEKSLPAGEAGEKPKAEEKEKEEPSIKKQATVPSKSRRILSIKEEKTEVPKEKKEKKTPKKTEAVK